MDVHIRGSFKQMGSTVIFEFLNRRLASGVIERKTPENVEQYISGT